MIEGSVRRGGARGDGWNFAHMMEPYSFLSKYIKINITLGHQFYNSNETKNAIK